MNVNLSASITANPRFFSHYSQRVQGAGSSSNQAKEFNSSRSMPGDLVFHSWQGRRQSEISTVQNTPEERKLIRDAIAAHLPKYHFWTGYIGDVNRTMGVNHYWEIPSDRIQETLSVIESIFKDCPSFPSYSQEPVPSVTLPPAILDDIQAQLEASLNQFEIYSRWFKEQAELMDYAANSIKESLAAFK